MDYEIVTLEEKTVAGLSVRTANKEPDMMGKIGLVWQRLFNGGEGALIPDKKNDTVLGLYTNYQSDVNGSYDMIACYEVTETAKLPPQFTFAVIPAGRYAKFIFHGDAEKDTGSFWNAVWNTPLERAYTGDFEEYPPSKDSHTSDIYIYIAVKG
ncbi:MAG: GyrI-like domain-containing protein [Spirochaetaceae bacterium]|jgi:predicted transcriptional regulator YdeE|nr:GyrI-like domain-containing protein [Spirochaetaceae bacterium]